MYANNRYGVLICIQGMDTAGKDSLIREVFKNFNARRLHLKDKIMQKFKLELLFHIVGIGSASGLLFNGGSLFIISDNSNVLYEYNIKQKKLDKIPLLTTDASTPEENIPKKDKPDFEAITASGDDLFLFGSGSKERRHLRFHRRRACNGS